MMQKPLVVLQLKDRVDAKREREPVGCVVCVSATKDTREVLSYPFSKQPATPQTSGPMLNFQWGPKSYDLPTSRSTGPWIDRRLEAPTARWGLTIAKTGHLNQLASVISS